MRRAFFLLTLLSTVLASTCAAQSAVSSKDEAPWRRIFNGNDFDGWVIKGSRGHAEVRDGEFVCHMVANTPEHTFVCTRESFTDFILEADCLLEGDFHTGFLLRCMETPPEAKVRLYGYQVKIDPTPRQWTGGVFDDYGPNWKWWYTLKNDARARSAFRMGEWNRFRMEVIGRTIKVWINGIPTANLINGKYASGPIAIKIHSMGNTPDKETTLVHYKNIRVITEKPDAWAREMDIPAVAVE